MGEWYTVLVCGSRTWTDKARIREVLSELKAADLRIIHGGARGADRLADEVAQELGIMTWEFLADWKRDGRRAGILRNLRMLEFGKPDEVLAFWDGSSKGTAHMIREARKAGVPVRIILEAS